MHSVLRWRILAKRPKCCPAISYHRVPERNPPYSHRNSSSVPQIIEKESDLLAVDDPCQEQWRDTHSKAKPPAHRRYAVNNPLNRVQVDPNLIDTESLSETLKAHQQANRAAPVVRHLRSDDSSNLKPRKFRRPTSSQLPNVPQFRSSEASNAIFNQRTLDPVAIKHVDLDRTEVVDSYGVRTDYKGFVQELTFDWDIVGNVSHHLRLPWMKNLDQHQQTRASSLERLSQEMLAANAFFTPKQSEVQAVRQAYEDVKGFILKHCSGLDMIGSRASGLASPLSDLDLNLVVRTEPGVIPEASDVSQMGHLYKLMRFPGNETLPFRVSYFAALARVPIIVGFHISTGLEFQIQSTSSCYGSLEVTKGLAAEFSNLKPLFRIIKQMLQMRGLGGKNGGLTSYPLMTMIAISLKMKPGQANSNNLGQSLLNFLDFWSNIDFYKTGITHLPSQYLSSNLNPELSLSRLFSNNKTELDAISIITQDPVGARPVPFDPRKPLGNVHSARHDFMMTVHDPANPYNDLGRSAYLIKHIQATFIDIRSKLKYDMSEWDQMMRTEGQARKNPPSLLRSLIEGDYSMYNLERKKLIPPIDE